MKTEVNMIVKSAVEAAGYYEKLLNAEVISITNLELGSNEAKFKIGDTAFRILDENPDYGMYAPKDGVPASIGINLIVKNIDKMSETAKNLSCDIISPVTDFGHAINMVIKDKFGHIWVVNQDME